MPLIHTELVNAGPGDKRCWLSDGRGLYLEVTPAANAARERVGEERHKFDAGIDPCEERKGNGETVAVTVPGDRFERIAGDWLAKHSPAWAPGLEPASWPRTHRRRRKQ